MKTVEVENSTRVVKQLQKRAKTALIRLTDRGRLVAYILPANRYDMEDIGYMTDPGFWEMIRERRMSDDGIPLEVVIAELEERERKEGARGANGAKHSAKRKAGSRHRSRKGHLEETAKG